MNCFAVGLRKCQTQGATPAEPGDLLEALEADHLLRRDITVDLARIVTRGMVRFLTSPFGQGISRSIQ